jgi:hypothetical protein
VLPACATPKINHRVFAILDFPFRHFNLLADIVDGVANSVLVLPERILNVFEDSFLVFREVSH